MVSRREVYKNLASAILLSVFTDIKNGYFDFSFIESGWAESICIIAGTPYSSFKEKAYNLKLNYLIKDF